MSMTYGKEMDIFMADLGIIKPDSSILSGEIKTTSLP